MKKTNVLLLAVAALGLGFTAVTTATTETAHAAYYYWTKTKNYSPSVAMKQKNPGTTAYMWNARHTAKLHNLKNYPRTTWYLSQSVKMTRGSKSAIYYRVTSGNGKVNGYVWRGYLTPGVYTSNTGVTKGIFTKEADSIPDLAYFTSDAQYLSFIKKAPLQEAARKILEAFPKAKLDLNLSNYAVNVNTGSWSEDAYQKGFYTSIPDKSKFTSTPVELKNTEAALEVNHSTDRYSKMLAGLAADGYSETVRKNFTGHLGLFIVDGINASEGTYLQGYGIVVMK